MGWLYAIDEYENAHVEHDECTQWQQRHEDGVHVRVEYGVVQRVHACNDSGTVVSRVDC